MKKLCTTLLLALAALSFPSLSQAADQYLCPGFTWEPIYKGHGMISIDFDPTGAMYVTEKAGRVLLFEPNPAVRGTYKDPVPLLDLTSVIYNDNESGVLGIAIDPQFNTTHYVYVFYTTPGDQKLARYTLNPARTALTDPLILIQGFPRTAPNHKAGDIHFRPGEPDHIYVVIGNDVPRDNSWTENLTMWNGKILRVNKADGKGLADNPFYDNNLDSIASRVWAVGFRNPFRFTFAPSGKPADTAYVSENGDGRDRFYQVEKGANGGWNQGGDRGLMNPPDKRVHILGTHSPSLTGIAIAETGPFASPQGPVLYEAHWYAPEEILRGVLGGPNWNTFTPIPTDPQGNFAVHLKTVNLKFGPDGCLYTNDAAMGPSLGNDFKLGRIRYTGAPAGGAVGGVGTLPATNLLGH